MKSMPEADPLFELFYWPSKLVPGHCGVTIECWSQRQALIVMKVVMAVHFYGLRNAPADEIVSSGPAPSEDEVGLRGIDAANKSRIATKIYLRIRGQSVVGKASCDAG